MHLATWTSSTTPKRAAFISLCLFWVVFILLSDYIIFANAPKSCDWPSVPAAQLHPNDAMPFNILIVSDPQILHYHSYPTRPYVVNYLTIKIADAYARKSFKSIINYHKPHGVIFLGDLLDMGVQITNVDDYSKYVDRFDHIFPKKGDIPRIHLPGNHDRGLSTTSQGVSKQFATYLMKRFQDTFGDINGYVNWGNHTLVWFDAQKLIEETATSINHDSVKNGNDDSKFDSFSVIKFLQTIPEERENSKKILFSHIPLWRPFGTTCGPYREHNNQINSGYGKNYQNEIDKATTEYILSNLKPKIIFSGDDHDYCEVLHDDPITHSSRLDTTDSKEGQKIREISVKSFSMTMGIRRPGYQLLSLYNDESAALSHLTDTDADVDDDFHSNSVAHVATLSTKNCELPDQIAIYTHVYIPVIIFSLILWIWIYHYRGDKLYKANLFIPKEQKYEA